MLEADAGCVVRTLVPASSVAAYHLYFPDPWPKRRHAARRIFTADLVDGIIRTLVPSGRLLVATDVVEYMHVMKERAAAGGLIARTAEPDHPGLSTAFARKYRAAGRLLYAATFVRTPG